jgi:hypothetical protein
LRAILNPGKPGLPADPLSALYSREFITERAYRAGRRYSGLVAAARRGWNIPSGSVAFWWSKIVAGPIDVIGGEIKNRRDEDESVISSVEAARLKLEAMRRELWRPGSTAWPTSPVRSAARCATRRESCTAARST